VVGTHSKLNTSTIEVNNLMVVIQVQVGKNLLEDVLIDGKANVNIITKNLSLPKPRLAPYHFSMVD
jgi:hypothetical protein